MVIRLPIPTSGMTFLSRILALCLVAALSAPLFAQGTAGFRFRVVADQNTVVPGTASLFERLGVPAIDEGRIAYLGWNDADGVGGLYVSQGDQTITFLNNDSDLPGTYTLRNALLGDHTVPAFHNGNAAVLVESHRNGTDIGREILAVIGGEIRRVARGQGTSYVDEPSFFGDRVAYRFSQPFPSPTSQLFWSPNGGGVLARTGNAAPSDLGVFFSISTVSALDDQVIAFNASTRLGSASPVDHVFAYRNGNLTPIVTDGMHYSGLTSPVTYFSSPIVVRGNVIIDVSLSSGDRFTLKHDGSSASIVSSPDEPIVNVVGETIGTLSLYLVDYDGGQRLFRSSDSIYADFGRGVTRILREGDYFQGKLISQIEVAAGRALSHGETAMSLQFDDGTEAIVVATVVPEPTSILLACVAAVSSAFVNTIRRRWRTVA